MSGAERIPCPKPPSTIVAVLGPFPGRAPGSAVLPASATSPSRGPLGPGWRANERLAPVYTFVWPNGPICRPGCIGLMTTRFRACTLVSGTRVPSASTERLGHSVGARLARWSQKILGLVESRRSIGCLTPTRRSSAAIAASRSRSPRVNRNFMLRKVSRGNPGAVRTAGA